MTSRCAAISELFRTAPPASPGAVKKDLWNKEVTPDSYTADAEKYQSAIMEQMRNRRSAHFVFTHFVTARVIDVHTRDPVDEWAVGGTAGPALEENGQVGIAVRAGHESWLPDAGRGGFAARSALVRTGC